MKHTLTLITLIFFCLSSSAQSGTDLEFSRTINETVTETNEVFGPVPQGRLWKLVGFSTGYVVFLSVNGEAQFPLNSYTSSTTYQAKLPLFFNEGDNLEFDLNGSGSNYSCYVSFIEYTVIP